MPKMPKSNDISALYDQFSGNANTFREIGRTARTVEASTRWPLFSQMSHERGTLVSSAIDQTSDAATQHHKAELTLKNTMPDFEPQLLPTSVRRASESEEPDLRDPGAAPSVWGIERRLTTEATLMPKSNPSTTVTRPMPGPTSPAAEPTLANFESRQLRSPIIRQAAATAYLKPAFSPTDLPVATSQPPLSPTQPNPTPVQHILPKDRGGSSPLRRLVRADPPAPDADAGNNLPFAEDLTSVFSRLAGPQSKEHRR